MSTNRMTFGTVLGTVTDAAVAVSTTLGTVTQGIGMLDEYVKVASLEQRARNVVRLESLAVTLQQEAAMEEIVRQKGVDEFLDKNQKYTDQYKSAVDRIGALLKSHNIGLQPA
jgi:adenylosuccinate synthase